jgi:preprotein translocase subunit SecE
MTKEKSEEKEKEDAKDEKNQNDGSSSRKVGTRKKSGPFTNVVLFIRQIINELKKVVTPTKDELIEYTIVVLVFVLVIMVFITGVDFAIGKGIMALFAK